MKKRDLLKTGIPRLDQKIGGIPEGKNLLYRADPEIEIDAFCLQSLYTNLWKNKEAFFLTLSKDPESSKKKLRDYGWEISKFEDSFHIIDGYSSLIGKESEADYVISDPENIHSIGKEIMNALEGHENSLLVVNSLSEAMDLCGEKSCLKFLENWKKRFEDNKTTSIFGYTQWPYSSDIVDKTKDLFDAVVRIRGMSREVVYGKYFRLEKAEWVNNYEKESVFFSVFKPGGVKIYLPKLLVTGPFSSGKSSFIRTLSTDSVSVDRLGTTISLDHGRVKKNHLFADVFGTPGQQRFDPILKKLGKKAMGVILVLDSTRPEQFARAQNMLEKVKEVNLPYIVVANKQDLEDALSPQEIRERMDLEDIIPIVPTVAIEGKGVQEAFDELTEMVLNNEVIEDAS